MGAYRNHQVFNLLPPIFRECVDDQMARYDLKLPFEVDGHIYASDGAIMVRVAATQEIRDELPPEGERRFPKGVPRLFEGRQRWESEPFALPSLEALPPCRSCKGTGVMVCRCCDRDGATCIKCLGVKVDLDKQPSVSAVGNLLLNTIYVDILSRHKATIFAPRNLDKAPEEIEVQGSDYAIYFTVEPGVEGLLQQCLREPPKSESQD